MVPNVSNNLCTLVPNIDKNYLPLVVVTKFLMKRRNHHGHNIYQTVQWNQKTSLKILWLVFEPSNLCMSLGCFCQEGGGRRRRRTLLAYVSSATKAYQWHRTYVITKNPCTKGPNSVRSSVWISNFQLYFEFKCETFCKCFWRTAQLCFA